MSKKNRFMRYLSYFILTSLLMWLMLGFIIISNFFKSFKDLKDWYWNTIGLIKEEYK